MLLALAERSLQLLKISHLMIAAATLCCTSFLSGCNGGLTVQERPGATGVCYSQLGTVKDGAIISLHQLVLVRSSGDLSKDITRINAASATRYSFQNPDTVANRWWSAWLDEGGIDATSGPDCSALPMFKR
jgi:hypothetical protein